MTQQQNTQLATTKPSMTLDDLVRSRKEVITQLLPKHLTAEKLLAMVASASSRMPKLKQCTVVSVLNSILKAGTLGLDCSGATGEAYLVPFNNKNGTVECQLITGYKGVIKMMKQAGYVTAVEARTVRSGDRFEYEYGLHPKCVHVPNETGNEAGEITHVYCVITQADGSKQFDVMSWNDIDRLRERSRAKDDGPWKTDFPEMAKKSVVLRLGKMQVKSAEAAEQFESEGRADRGEMIDAELVNPTEQLNAKLRKARGALPPTEPPQEQPVEEEPQADPEPPQPPTTSAAAAPLDTAPVAKQQDQPVPPVLGDDPTPTEIIKFCAHVDNRPTWMTEVQAKEYVKGKFKLLPKPWEKTDKDGRQLLIDAVRGGFWPHWPNQDQEA